MKNLLIILMANLALVPVARSEDLVSLKDGILFAFEKCKTLSVDLEKGQLKESVTSSFDVHCSKKSDKYAFDCSFFDSRSDKKIKTIEFHGGSNLGSAVLKTKDGKSIHFLIGKKFASFEDDPKKEACVGIYLFEKEALKKKK